jgi:hypothetical protein
VPICRSIGRYCQCVFPERRRSTRKLWMILLSEMWATCSSWRLWNDPRRGWETTVLVRTLDCKFFGGLGVILCKFYGPLLGWSIIALFKFS